jgi:parallel beta-helix repeat protein
MGRSLRVLQLVTLALIPWALHAQTSTLVECDGGAVFGDNLNRGFYVTDYPGTSINGVTVQLKTTGGSAQYQVGLDVTEGSFDGPLVASGFADATIDGTEQAVSIQMTSGGQTNPPVTPGATLCFSFFVNAGGGAPSLLYSVIGALGEDLPDAEDPCPHVVQTTGTAPPLSSFRREGVKLAITGDKFLDVNPGQTIQLAIDGADPGDAVRVAPGTYQEDLTLRDGVDVIGSGADETNLRGTGSGDVVTASGVTEAEFSGFTVENSGPDGAGFYIDGGSPFIKDNTVTGNTDGIRLVGGTSAFVCGNTVRGNGNGANGIIDWGIIILSGSTPLISNNFVLENEVGVYLFQPGTDGSEIINNTVLDNQNDGIWCNNSSPTIKNNLVANNQGAGISGLGADAVPRLSYNNVWENQGLGNYNAQNGAVVGPGLGSISADPLLDADLRLMEGSPCIDAGDPAAIYNDLDGSRNDIGATGGPCGSGIPPGTAIDGFLWTSVGTIAVADIDQGSGAKAGLTTSGDRPFGGKPWLYGPFGSSETSVHRYAVKVGRWSGGTPPAAADFEYIDDPLSKVRYDVSGGAVTSSNVALGPQTFSGVPAYQPTSNGGGTYWAHENLRLILNTRSLVEGRYSIRMEAYDFFGNPVSLSPNEDLVLMVNNTPPEVEIDAISFGGNPPIDECAIIDLASPTSTLDFTFTASHPDGYLDNYSLVAEVGRNRSGGTIAGDSYANHVDPAGVWNGETMTSVAATPASPEPSLPALQQWERCAYQFRIRAWARTTNGFGRIYRIGFFTNHAIDLGGGGSSPDLDGDGDVDGEDLAIFAEAFGSSNP